MDGYLSIVLTGHVPYLGKRDEPYLQDMVCSMIAFGLIPAINLLTELGQAGNPIPVGLALSPVLLEQLAEPQLQQQVERWLENWLARHVHTLAEAQQRHAEHSSYLARFSIEWGQGILRSFTRRYKRNLLNPLRELCSQLAEPLCVPATHPYLPFLSSTAVDAQIDLGIQVIRRVLRAEPRGLWLPECGFDPALFPALERAGQSYLIADPSAIIGHSDVPLRPRWVGPGPLQVLFRTPSISELIWSDAQGYPGDPLYRSERIDPHSGMAIWRHGVRGSDDELYDPYDAFRRAADHADHFLATLTAELEQFRTNHDQPGIAVLAIDLELLRNHWFEGFVWLRAVCERSHRGDGPSLTAPSDYLLAYPSRQATGLRESSWGPGSDHRTWNAPAAQAIRQQLAMAEQQLAMLADRFRSATGIQQRALTHAARLLLLMQSSDWLLLAESSAGAVVARHIQQLLAEFGSCCAIAAADQPEEYDDQLTQLEAFGTPFRELDYRALG